MRFSARPGQHSLAKWNPSIMWQQAGTRSLCLHCKRLEMNFSTLLSFILSICEFAGVMIEEHVKKNSHKRMTFKNQRGVV